MEIHCRLGATSVRDPPASFDAPKEKKKVEMMTKMEADPDFDDFPSRCSLLPLCPQLALEEPSRVTFCRFTMGRDTTTISTLHAQGKKKLWHMMQELLISSQSWKNPRAPSRLTLIRGRCHVHLRLYTVYCTCTASAGKTTKSAG